MSDDEIDFMGLKIKIGTPEEAEEASYVVCVPAHLSGFSDDLYGRCCICDCMVVFRPYMPKRPKRICLACWQKVERPS